MAKYSQVTAGQTEACINRLGGWDNFLRFIGGEGRVVFESKPILTFLHTTRISAQPSATISEEYFKKEAEVVLMGDNFRAQFLGLRVPAVEETEIAVRKLEEPSFDTHILDELGNRAEISVSQFQAFLAANHRSSALFVFYLRGKDGRPWAVGADWVVDRGGWYVYADSVTNQFKWRQGYRVVSQV